MKKVKYLALSAILATNLYGNSIYVENTGWNLMGASTTLNANTDFNDNKVNVVWAFDNNTKSWMGYSPNSSIMNAISTNGISPLGQIQAGVGYWINVNQAGYLNSDSNNTGSYITFYTNFDWDNNSQNSQIIYLAKNSTINIDLCKYVSSGDNNFSCSNINTTNNIFTNSGLTLNGTTLSGTPTQSGNVGSFTLSTSSISHTVNISIVDNPDSNDSLNIVYGQGVTSNFNFSNVSTTNFYDIWMDDGLPKLGVINIDYTRNNLTYKEYEQNNGTWEEDGHTEELNITLKRDKSFDISAEQEERISLISAKAVSSINGVATNGLYEATIEIETLSSPSTNYDSIDDWWGTWYNNNGTPITTLESLEYFLVDNQYATVWLNENYQVYLKPNGQLVQAMSDGIYGKCINCGDREYYKKMYPSSTTISGASWSLSNGYLSVQVPNQGSTVFKVDNNSIVQTEIRPIGFKETMKWYYGVDQQTFINTFNQISQ